MAPIAAWAQTAPGASTPLAIGIYAPIPVQFGFVSVNETSFPEQTITVQNLGSQELVISNIESNNPAVTVTPTSLPPIPQIGSGSGDSPTVTLTYTPLGAELLTDHTATTAVTFTSNDAFNTTYALPVFGEGIDVSIDVLPFHQVVVPGEQIQYRADVIGSSAKQVTWSLLPETGAGTITSRGLYTAPDIPIAELFVVATSVADPLVSNQGTVAVYGLNTTEQPAVALGAGQLGTQVLSADLDGDGFIEIIAAAPSADVGVTGGAGQVWIRSFDDRGFLSLPTIRDNSPILINNAPQAGAGFGTAIQLADLDRDGTLELLVGEPRGGIDGRGIVHVYAGFTSNTGFATHGSTNALTLPVVGSGAGAALGDRFGAALSTGTPEATANVQIVVGAPGTTQASPLGVDLPAAGQVYLLDVGDVTVNPIALTLSARAPLKSPVPEAGAEFGASLITACFNFCSSVGLDTEPTQRNDVIVAAPNASFTQGATPLAGAGRVYVFTDQVNHTTNATFDAAVTTPLGGVVTTTIATTAGISTLTEVTVDTTPDGTTTTEIVTQLNHLAVVREIAPPQRAANAHFGTALAVADFTVNSIDDLVISAPGQPVGTALSPVAAGMVFTYVTDGDGQNHYTSYLRDATPVTGQRFGQSLNIVDLDSGLIPDLTVGAPGSVGNGKVLTYLSNARGDYFSMRQFTADTPQPGDHFGHSTTWADLNQDGHLDLIVGAPDADASAGQLHLKLDTPPEPVAITPRVVTVAMSGNTGTSRSFTSKQGSSSGWELLSTGGSIDVRGEYLPPASSNGPFDAQPLLRMRDRSDNNQWALARIHLVKRAAELVAPQVFLPQNPNDPVQLGPPEEGIKFGSTLAAGQLGRHASDPFPNHPSVLVGFQAVNTGSLPRLHNYPYDDIAEAPFSALDYFSDISAQRTGWGDQPVIGDFDGDGNQDVAISAPFAATSQSCGQSDPSPQPRVGYIVIFFLGADGKLRTRQDTGTPNAVCITVNPFATDQNDTIIWPATQPGNPRPDPSNPALRNRSNSQWGFRMIAADIDHNGRTDLIIGAPHADVNGIRDAGFIELLLAPNSITGDWATALTRQVITSPTPRQHGYFGSAMTLGDINGNGTPELYVSAPGRDPSEAQLLFYAPGKVWGWELTPTNLVPPDWTDAAALRAAFTNITPLIINDPTPVPLEPFAGFGLSLATGNLIRDDLADELVIGAPFQAVKNTRFLDPFGNRLSFDIGSVWVYDGGPGHSVTEPTAVHPPYDQLDMRFGHALSIRHLGNGAQTQLVVGAPFYRLLGAVQTGAIMLYDSVTSPQILPQSRLMVSLHSQPGQSFGSAIVSIDLDLDGTDELIVGAPNSTVDKYLGFTITPGRFGGITQIIARQEQAGRAYVIFPEP